MGILILEGILILDDFAADEIQAGETSVFVRSGGSGPPVLLLHGFPQTHLRWRGVAPLDGLRSGR
jgi:haloacetate dehalogenase